MNARRILAIAIFSLILPHAKSQLTPGQGAQLVQLNTITTAVPFLMIGPDSRSGALGDAGVALSPDANSLHWNPAKMAFASNDVEFSLGYAPWLRALVDDMNLAYLSGVNADQQATSLGSCTALFQPGKHHIYGRDWNNHSRLPAS